MSASPEHRLHPFPGLRPFRSDEHHLFFGREEQTAALLQLLRTNRFLAVVGTSGSGKSSLVRAGMIAELYGGTMTQAGSTWEVVLLRPGGNPIENLARSIVDAELYDAEDPETLPRLRATLTRSRFGLVEAMKQSDLFEPKTNLLVVVDQFEELFRFRQQGIGSEEAATAFVKLLLTASEQQEHPIYVTLTMRSDYLGDCSQIPGLAEAVNQGEYLIPRLLRDQKRDAIEKPLGVGGAKISPLLVQRLLNDIGDDPDQLPVLQHALMRMWDLWIAVGAKERAIDFCDLEAIGGLASALSNHADEIYDALPDDLHRQICERIFKTLTEKGSDNRGIRRPTQLAKIASITAADQATSKRVLDAYRQTGVTFLMPGTDRELDEQVVLDLSHESLMRGWRRLRTWVEEEAQSARIFRRLLDTSWLWREGKAGLFRDPDLQIALTWRDQQQPNADWAEQYGGDFETALGFLENSAAEATADQQAREAARQRELDQAQKLAEAQQFRLEQQQRSARRLRATIGVFAVVALFAVIACISALRSNSKANVLAALATQEAENAQASADEARQAQQETAEAMAIVATQNDQIIDSLTKAEAAELLALEQAEQRRVSLYATDMQLVPHVWADEEGTAERLQELIGTHIPNDGESDLRDFEWSYYSHLLNDRATVLRPQEPVALSTLTHDGELITIDFQSQLQHWNLETDEVESTLNLAPEDDVVLGEVSADGTVVALATSSRIYLLNSSTGKEISVINLRKNETPQHMVFSGDSRLLITADTTVHWWDTDTGTEVAFHNVFAPCRHLSVSSDGQTVAVIPIPDNFAVHVLRLDPESNRVSVQTPFRPSDQSLRQVAVSPDGRLVAAYSAWSRLTVHDVDTGRRLHFRKHPGRLTLIQFSLDGSRLVTAANDGLIQIWRIHYDNTIAIDSADDLDVLQLERMLKGHTAEVTDVRFAIDGDQLVSMGRDSTTRVWDLNLPQDALHSLADYRMQLVPFGFGEFGNVTRFSPDGLLIAAITPLTNGIGLWDGHSGQLVQLMGADEVPVASIAFSSDNKSMAVGHVDAHVSVWDIDTASQIVSFEGFPGFEYDTDGAASIAFSPDGEYLVAGFANRGEDRPLRIWNLPTRQLHQQFNLNCGSIAFSPTSPIMATVDLTGTVTVWDTQNWEPIGTLSNPDQYTSAANPDVVFSPDGSMIATGGGEGTIVLWDAATRNMLHSFEGHSDSVNSLAFSPLGRTLASGSFDDTVRLWNVATWRQLTTFRGDGINLPYSFDTLSFSPDGTRLLTEGRMGIWKATPDLWDRPVQAAETLATLVDSQADFRSRFRMLSENLRLHEALETLQTLRPENLEVLAASAAARANWHASRLEWQLAAAEFDHLVEFSQNEPDAWLRTPGLLRLTMALLQVDRPIDAAGLLTGGAERRIADGLPAIQERVALGFQHSSDGVAVRVQDLVPGSPAARSSMQVGDIILSINDVEISADSIPEIGELLAGDAGTVVRLTVRHTESDQPEEIELVKDSVVIDSATGDLLAPLLTEIDERLAEHPDDAALLELRAELAGQWQASEDQLVDFTAAINVLAELEDSRAELSRLYRRRGDVQFGLKQWPPAAADYSLAVTHGTIDELLLASQAWADDSLMWLRIAAVLVLAGEDSTYPEYCAHMVRQFSESDAPEDVERTVKACLLQANSIELALLPSDRLARSLDEGTAPQGFLAWGWGTRGLLAFRSGDAESAVKYVTNSEDCAPGDFSHAMNLAILAMAQNHLQHPDEAREALEAASQLIQRLQEVDSNKGHHDLLIAELLLREANGMINRAED